MINIYLRLYSPGWPVFARNTCSCLWCSPYCWSSGGCIRRIALRRRPESAGSSSRTCPCYPRTQASCRPADGRFGSAPPSAGTWLGSPTKMSLDVRCTSDCAPFVCRLWCYRSTLNGIEKRKINTCYTTIVIVFIKIVTSRYSTYYTIYMFFLIVTLLYFSKNLSSIQGRVINL